MADHHEELMLCLTQQEWAQWQHNPVTAAFFVFLEDQETNFMDNIAERFVAGMLYEKGGSDGVDSQDHNASVLRGRVIALRETRRITLADLQAFYRDKRGEPQPEDEDDRANARDGPG